MLSNKLIEEYRKLNPSFKKLYVVPLINYHIKNSDYLYLLHKPALNDPAIEVINLSVFKHYKLLSSGVKDSVLHYHWFEAKDRKSLIGIFWKLLCLLLYKLMGGKIVWTIHNRFPHSQKYLNLNKVLRRFFAKNADRLHVHCNYAAGIMSGILKVNENKFFVHEHPMYPAVFMDKEEAINKLKEKYDLTDNRNAKIFLSFGAIAPYKGIEGLIKLFSSTNRQNILLIAGPVKKGEELYFSQLKKAAKVGSNIILINKMIPDEDVSYFFNSADYVLFNYREILTSGGVMLGLSYNKHVIAPSMGCIREIKNENLTLFEGSANLENILKIIWQESNAH